MLIMEVEGDPLMLSDPLDCKAIELNNVDVSPVSKGLLSPVSPIWIDKYMYFWSFRNGPWNPKPK